ncbi:MAG: hypothetical protein WCK18_11675 [Prolixibacteraceae bacterium]
MRKNAFLILSTDLFQYSRKYRRMLAHRSLNAISILLILLLSGCSKEFIGIESANTVTNPSAYVNKIFDYQYGPGQHASFISPTEKANDFIGEPWTKNKSFISLGGWGGYVIAGFNHAVLNTNGPDLAVFTQPSVSSEPGIVYVMEDINNDGLPNDGTWYELRGSEYSNPETIHNYEVTYFKPGLSGYVTWKDNLGKTGSLVPGFGNDNWWWSGYGVKSSITFTGERLPDAYENTSKDQAVELWLQRSGLFQSGYAECYYNADYNEKLKANMLDISSAVDASGKPLNLTKINFIKVQSSVFQIAGWLNEVSTEISGAADIHFLDKNSY